MYFPIDSLKILKAQVSEGGHPTPNTGPSYKSFHGGPSHPRKFPAGFPVLVFKLSSMCNALVNTLNWIDRILSIEFEFYRESHFSLRN